MDTYCNANFNSFGSSATRTFVSNTEREIATVRGELVAEILGRSVEEEILAGKVVELEELNAVLSEIDARRQVAELVVHSPAVVALHKLRLDLGVEELGLLAIDIETIAKASRTIGVAIGHVQDEMTIDALLAVRALTILFALTRRLLVE